jgi:hypothetical protein
MKLLCTVMKNGQLSDPKYKSINLAGKAGTKLKNSEEAMTLLTAAGWEVVGDNLVFPDTSSVEALSIFAAELQERYDALTAAVAAAAPALSAGDPAPSGNLSIKQQARRDQEEREKRERLAAAAQKKKSSGPSLKQQARMAEEKKASADRAAEAEMKADLKRKLEADKLERADPNWSASVAGDKSKGKSMSTFREKFGEDKGG